MGCKISCNNHGFWTINFIIIRLLFSPANYLSSRREGQYGQEGGERAKCGGVSDVGPGGLCVRNDTEKDSAEDVGGGEPGRG